MIALEFPEMPRAQRQPRTLLEVAAWNIAQQLGDGSPKLRHHALAVKQAGDAGAALWQFVAAAQSLGRWPTVPEFAEFWEMSERNAWRRVALVGRAWPGSQDEGDLAVVDRIGRRIWADRVADYEQPAELLSLPAVQFATA